MSSRSAARPGDAAFPGDQKDPHASPIDLPGGTPVQLRGADGVDGGLPMTRVKVLGGSLLVVGGRPSPAARDGYVVDVLAMSRARAPRLNTHPLLLLVSGGTPVLYGIDASRVTPLRRLGPGLRVAGGAEEEG